MHIKYTYIPNILWTDIIFGRARASALQTFVRHRHGTCHRKRFRHTDSRGGDLRTRDIYIVYYIVGSESKGILPRYFQISCRRSFLKFWRLHDFYRFSIYEYLMITWKSSYSKMYSLDIFGSELPTYNVILATKTVFFLLKMCVLRRDGWWRFQKKKTSCGPIECACSRLQRKMFLSISLTLHLSLVYIASRIGNGTNLWYMRIGRCFVNTST